MKKDNLYARAVVWADSVREVQRARKALTFARNNELGGNDEEHSAAGRLLHALTAQDRARAALDRAARAV